MIVVDTSVWVELLKGSGHPTATALKRLITRGSEIAITEVVAMELLAGAAPATQPQLRSHLLALPMLRLNGLADFEEAAAIYRACRERGRTVRSQLDLLIAVPTIRHGGSLLHNDHDFDVIEEVAGLNVERI